jgi:hypothetical protein
MSEVLDTTFNARMDLADILEMIREQEQIIRSGMGDTAHAVNVLRELDKMRSGLIKVLEALWRMST